MSCGYCAHAQSPVMLRHDGLVVRLEEMDGRNYQTLRREEDGTLFDRIPTSHCPQCGARLSERD